MKVWQVWVTCVLLTAFWVTILEQENRIEPSAEAKQGLIGFHFRSARSGQIKMVQLAGDEPDWQSADLDLVASRLMVLDMQNKGNAMPLPQLLGYQQLGILPKFA